MLNFIRIILTLLLIVLIVPQTTTENTLLRTLNNSKVFANYGEAKFFLNFFTWLIIVLFLIITYLANVL